MLGALETGLVDSVQVVYNIFDQAPEDELFPFCQAHDIAVIARVPFDEGSLTGTLTPDSTLARRRLAEHLLHAATTSAETLARVERLEPLRPGGDGPAGAGAALHPRAPGRDTTIPGMRRPAHVERNLAASDGEPLPPRLATR